MQLCGKYILPHLLGFVNVFQKNKRYFIKQARFNIPPTRQFFQKRASHFARLRLIIFINSFEKGLDKTNKILYNKDVETQDGCPQH